MDTRIANACVGILKRDDVKREIKSALAPLMDVVLVDIYPYIYLSLIFVIISFILHLGIFILLFKERHLLSKRA